MCRCWSLVATPILLAWRAASRLRQSPAAQPFVRSCSCRATVVLCATPAATQSAKVSSPLKRRSASPISSISRCARNRASGISGSVREESTSVQLCGRWSTSRVRNSKTRGTAMRCTSSRMITPRSTGMAASTLTSSPALSRRPPSRCADSPRVSGATRQGGSKGSSASASDDRTRGRSSSSSALTHATASPGGSRASSRESTAVLP